MDTKENRNRDRQTGNYHQPQIGGKDQTVLTDPAITAETDEAVPAYNQQVTPADPEEDEQEDEDDFPVEEDLEDDYDLDRDTDESGLDSDEDKFQLKYGHMEHFSIAVAHDGEKQFYNIKSLGNSRYQIYIEEETIGTIQLDEKDHARCESQGCELDMPLLNSIRDAIHAFERGS